MDSYNFIRSHPLVENFRKTHVTNAKGHRKVRTTPYINRIKNKQKTNSFYMMGPVRRSNSMGRGLNQTSIDQVNLVSSRRKTTFTNRRQKIKRVNHLKKLPDDVFYIILSYFSIFELILIRRLSTTMKLFIDQLPPKYFKRISDRFQMSITSTPQFIKILSKYSSFSSSQAHHLLTLSQNNQHIMKSIKLSRADTGSFTPARLKYNFPQHGNMSVKFQFTGNIQYSGFGLVDPILINKEIPEYTKTPFFIGNKATQIIHKTWYSGLQAGMGFNFGYYANGCFAINGKYRTVKTFTSSDTLEVNLIPGGTADIYINNELSTKVELPKIPLVFLCHLVGPGTGCKILETKFKNNKNRDLSFNKKMNFDKEYYKQEHIEDLKNGLGCNTWTFLHSMAATYPKEPTMVQKMHMMNLLQYFGEFYPCKYCAKDFQKYMEENPPNVNNRYELSIWMCEAHNDVNEKLGKPLMDCTAIWRRWSKNEDEDDEDDEDCGFCPDDLKEQMQNIKNNTGIGY